MSLELIKIEEGLHDGEVLYHKLVEKTDEEKKAIRTARENKKKEKEQRKKQQDLNVKKKLKSKDEHKKKSLEGMAHKRNANLPDGFKATADDAEESSDDDDAQYYQDEVGEKPDKDMFDMSAGFRKRSSSMPNLRGNKRFRGGGRGGRGSDRRGRDMSRGCLLYTSPSPRDRQKSRMPSSA